MLDFTVNWLANTPGFAAPFALAALGLIITERSGVLSLTAEGFMLIGALSGVGAYILLGNNPYLALIASMLAAVLTSLLFGLLVIVLRVNQIIAGLALVYFCQGLTSMLGAKFGWSMRTIAGLSELDLWPLSEIPVVGKLLFHQNLIVYLLVPIFFSAHYLLNRTMLGLRLRAVGENPDAADAAGVDIALYRFGAVAAGAALMGLAGGYLSVVVAKIWVDNMTGGRGWIAVALVIFARWRPWRALAGAFLFGCIEALIPRIAAIGVQVPQYFILMTPYLATLAVMVWTSLQLHGVTNEPGALGRPHVREERH